ncbi:hypothetical protein FEM48_Zijuj05G0064700 [Ziziphus jujuba var. spinosa]|uniref:Uncharacterized protein n=1 Tax=Ziziphus jujuba var. spinosa TaxID=714518 RepID=A0A978VDC5_ZIZJJ|nr:hypothetical protein FEM48_Zijuj05G0064700 [Ziziphus jujuba var. spinosa]
MFLNLGYNPTLLVSSADMLREMTTFHDIVFSNRPKYIPADIFFNGFLDDAFLPYDHKAALKQPSSSEAKDFVDILLQLQNDGVLDVEFSNVNLKAILLGLFVGGSDMVSTALEWTMSELSRNDKILRPHPPAVLIFRQTSESVKLGAYHIAPKTRVLITTWAIQRDQNFGDRPEEEFVPERFENNHVDFKGLDFQFIPFGVGRRRCPGSTFGVFYD